MTDEDRRLIETVRKLESPKCREDLIFHAEAMVRAPRGVQGGLWGLTRRFLTA
jgi:hypothetical protein